MHPFDCDCELCRGATIGGIDEERDGLSLPDSWVPPWKREADDA